MNEKILKQIKAIKELAKRGIGGEKENAENMYRKLIKKYNISESDLTEGKEYKILLGKKWDIFSQIKMMTVITIVGKNNSGTYKNRNFGSYILFNTTFEIYKMIREMMYIYCNEYKRSLKIFNHAFFIRQNLTTILDNEEYEELTKEQKEKMRKAQMMSDYIDKREFHKKITEEHLLITKKGN